MKLIKLRKHETGDDVYVNPDHIVSIEQSEEGYLTVYTDGRWGNGNTISFDVSNKIENIEKQIAG